MTSDPPRPRVWPLVALLVLATVAVRLPFLGTPLGRDEGGFLLVASQWRPGSSLYGDYWVDRPPGLMLLFAAADVMGGRLPLRLLGVVAAAATVATAALLAHVVIRGRRMAVVGAAATAALLVSSRLFDATETTGELLAVPWVLGGLAATAGAYRHALLGGVPTWRLVLRAGLAGALGAAAVSMKQNFVDVAVVAVPLLIALALRGRVRPAVTALLSAAAGGLLVGAVLLLVAAARGTAPLELWDAVVVFRAEAGEVISRSSTPAIDARGRELLVVFAASGAPALLLLLAGLRWWTRHMAPREARRVASLDPAWAWACLALLAWETTTVVLGGSYWWHYLMSLVPGLALLTALALGHPGRPKRLALLLLPVGVATASGVATLTLRPPVPEPAREHTVAYLQQHVAPGDTASVLFGNPDIQWASGADSPYEYLWSLMVRVRDPDLRQLSEVLGSADRPTWVVMPARGLTTWGVSAQGVARVESELRASYDVARSEDGLMVLRARTPTGAGPRADLG